MYMNYHWKELLPIDHYNVRANGLLHEFDHKVLTYLYQPLIGIIAIGIYQTLWQEVQENQYESEKATHHTLISRINLPLNVFYQERKKLEAIGLLKTYRKERTEEQSFIYELQPPLTPDQFFNDGVLNIYLFNRVGKGQYTHLKELFSYPKIDKDYEELTASFNEVFSSLTPSELSMTSETEKVVTLDSRKQWVHRQEDRKYPFNTEQFNYQLLFQKLSDVILPKEAFTPEVKEAIAKLAFIYHLEPEELANIIQRAFLHDASIDIAKLRKEVQKYYRIDVGDALPALSERRQPLTDQEMRHKEPKNEEEKLIVAFETMSPYELLELLGDGARPTAPDLKIVEEILFEQKLNPGVMNVLIHYVMETNDQKLVKAYTEKIAGHWARKKVKTVRDAMTLAREEHRKYQSWSNNKRESETKQPRNTKRNKRVERLPKWMTQDEPQASNKSTDTEEQQWLENYLKDL